MGRTRFLSLAGAIGLGAGLIFGLLTWARSTGVGGTGWLSPLGCVLNRSLSPASVPLQTTQAITPTRGPYLQSVTTDTITVVWETREPARSQVSYGITSTYDSVVSSTLPTTHHALTLTDLNPYYTYHYRVSSDGRPLGKDSTFRTAASPTQTAFSFVVFGDTRSEPEMHRKVVSRVLSLSPGFALHLGDFVHDGSNASQWDTFFAVERDLLRQVPLFAVLGNHEGASANYFAAFHLPGNERWYSFDYGDAHFVVLEVDGFADYSASSAQYAWLENDLASTPRRWKFVFFHIPPYSAGPYGGDSVVRDTLVPLFAHYGVQIVFAAHDHAYERSVVGGVTYIVTGGGGAPLYSKGSANPYSVYFTKVYHCVHVTVNGDSLSSVGVQLDGTQFDPFTIPSLR